MKLITYAVIVFLVICFILISAKGTPWNPIVIGFLVGIAGFIGTITAILSLKEK